MEENRKGVPECKDQVSCRTRCDRRSVQQVMIAANGNEQNSHYDFRRRHNEINSNQNQENESFGRRKH
jgi:Na+-transporting NADH:ubiquinone oxidoreductase subunit NqrA